MPKKQPQPSYQALKQELDSILADLQSEDLDVDEAVAKYKRGLELAQTIEKYLKTAQNEIRQLKTKTAKRS